MAPAAVAGCILAKRTEHGQHRSHVTRLSRNPSVWGHKPQMHRQGGQRNSTSCSTSCLLPSNLNNLARLPLNPTCRSPEALHDSQFTRVSQAPVVSLHIATGNASFALSNPAYQGVAQTMVEALDTHPEDESTRAASGMCVQCRRVHYSIVRATLTIWICLAPGSVFGVPLRESLKTASVQISTANQDG